MRTITKERLRRLADLGDLKLKFRGSGSRHRIELSAFEWVEEYETLKEAAAFCRGYIRGMQDAHREEP